MPILHHCILVTPTVAYAAPLGYVAHHKFTNEDIGGEVSTWSLAIQLENSFQDVNDGESVVETNCKGRKDTQYTHLRT